MINNSLVQFCVMLKCFDFRSKFAPKTIKSLLTVMNTVSIFKRRSNAIQKRPNIDYGISNSERYKQCEELKLGWILSVPYQVFELLFYSLFGWQFQKFPNRMANKGICRTGQLRTLKIYHSRSGNRGRMRDFLPEDHPSSDRRL